MKRPALPHRLRAPFGCLLAAVVLAIGGCSEKPKDPKAGLRPVSVLAQEAAGQDAAKRRDAYRDLALYGPDAAPAMPMLLQQVRSDDLATRRAAAGVLGKVGDAAYKPALAMLVESNSPSDKRGGAMVLGELGDKACPALPDLVDATESAYPELRAAAAVAAGKVLRACDKEPEEKPSTIRIKDPRLTELAQIVVGSEGASTSAGGGFAEVRHVKPKEGDIRRSLGTFGINADQLGQLPDEEAPEVEINVGWGQKPAATTVPPRGRADVVPALGRLLAYDEEPAVRAAAAKGLGYVGPGAAKAAGVLASGLHDDDVTVGQNCAWALGELGPGNKEAAATLKDFRPKAPAELRPAVDAALEALKAK